jgi:hypothetical protein
MEHRIAVLAQLRQCISRCGWGLLAGNAETGFVKEISDSGRRSVSVSRAAFFDGALFIWSGRWGSKLFGDGRREWNIACRCGRRGREGVDIIVVPDNPFGTAGGYGRPLGSKVRVRGGGVSY